MHILLITFLILYYIRPFEWVSGLIGVPLLLWVGIVAVTALLFRGNPDREHALSNDVGKMMVGFICAIGLSHFSHFYFSGAVNSLSRFLPSIAGFFLVLACATDMRRLRLIIMLLVCLTSVVAFEGVREYLTGFAHGGLEPIYQQISSAEGGAVKVARIRWYGVFNDPNDLGLMFVLVIPFLVDMLFNRKVVLAAIAIALIGSGLYCTNSRGSALAALFSIASYFVFRYRSTKGALVGTLLAVLLSLAGPSRMGGMSAAEESAHGRLDAWYQAYQMLKSSPLFGVGQGMFTDFHPLTAHNSFVLVMAELGIVGLFFFSGLVFHPYHWLWNVLFRSRVSFSSADNGTVSAVFASLTGVMVAIFFISRSYVLIPFLAIALATAIAGIVERQHDDLFTRKEVRHSHGRQILLITAGQIVAVNIMVKLLL